MAQRWSQTQKRRLRKKTPFEQKNARQTDRDLRMFVLSILLSTARASGDISEIGRLLSSLSALHSGEDGYACEFINPT